MSKRKATGAQVSKRRPNFTGAEVEVMLQGVEVKRGILFSSVNEGYKPSQKNEAWDEITREVNVVSGQGRTSAEVKKKWADVKSEAKKIIAKVNREIMATGGGTAGLRLGEMDQRIQAILGTTAVAGVPGAEHLDTASKCVSQNGYPI